MRFTKIPLIATLMAVALSLLIVLPTLAQVSGDRTDGRVSVGSWVDARVADNLDDLDRTATAAGAPNTPASIDTGVASYAVAGFDAQDTYFNGDLYVSNDDNAYNTILITARVSENTAGVDAKTTNIASVLSGPDGKFAGDGTTDATDPDGLNDDNFDCLGDGVAVATIKNDRSNTRVTAYLPVTSSTTATGAIYQGTVAIWDQEDELGAEAHSGPCDVAHTDPERYAGSNQQNTEATDAGVTDAAEILEYSPDGSDGWTDASSALIPSRDGDTLTITVKGVSGSIRVIVDGDAPEIEDVSPASGGTQNKTTVSLGFRVSDDGSGIRYDGESGSSNDADLTPHNGDADQRFDEPYTKDATGATMDIDVFFGTQDKAYNPVVDFGADGALGGGDDVLADPDEAQKDAPDGGQVGILDDTDAEWGENTESSQYGSNGWTQIVKGVTYDLDMRLVGKQFGTYFWQVSATDRVGNKATTDADEDEKKNQPFSFKVDDAGPRVDIARTGVGYKAREGEFADRSWIALNFINGNDTILKTRKGGADRIDSSTVEAGDFTVEGYTVMNALVPSDKKVCVGDNPLTDAKEDAKNITAFDAGNGSPVENDPKTPEDESVNAEAPTKCNFEPRARIYLELSEELGSDETPTIQLLGGVLKDIAGNNNETQSVEKNGDDGRVVDRIAPGVSITITSSSGATGRAATDNEGSFTVRVTSDEDLNKFPRLYFATMKGTAEFKNGKPGLAGEKTLKIADATDSPGIEFTEKENNVWEKKVNASAIVGVNVDSPITEEDDRLVAVIITAQDEEGNSGNSAGWKDGGGAAAGPDEDDELTFKKLDAGGFLVEIDSTLKPAKIDVLPPVDPDAANKNKTESMNPYIQIAFSEHNEYGIAVTEPDDDDATTDEASGTALAADIGSDDKSGTDSHRNVELTSLTLNGENRLAEVVQVDPWKYVLAVTGLEIGEYELVYSATDDVGNTVEVDDDDATFEFEVLERQPYEVDLNPGWNLISLPGDPFNPAVGEVVGADLRADTVLGYQGGEWVTAVRNEEGRWQGTLTIIVGGYGYWVRTTAVETIETVIPPNLPTSVLPTVPVVSGWNLVGVVDAEQRPVDEGVGEDADEYLTSLGGQWRVAYSFETQLNTWNKVLPDGENALGEPHMMLNGKGYWLWNTRPGTLVP